LGNELRVNFTGTTIFTSERTKSDVTSWHIDKFIQQEFNKIIVQDGQYSHVDIAHDVADSMMNIYSAKQTDCCSRKYDLSRVRKEIENIRSQYGIDTLIVILESDYQGQLGARTANLVGYGLYRATFLGLNETATFAYARVIAIDTASLEELGSASITTSQFIDQGYWQSGFDNLEPQQKQFIENTIKLQLWKNLVLALQDMKLIKQKEFFPAPTQLLPTEQSYKKDMQTFSGIAATCNNPFALSQDCSNWSGAKRKIKINGVEAKIAGSEDGKVVMVMGPSLFSGSLSINADKALDETANVLKENGIAIKKVTGITLGKNIAGYFIELDGDGYKVLKKYSME